ncbi:MAG TPA: DUF2142 domain-containing protein [Solirubrobacteraceae bacterium]|nr:DUF2142 domain-containing protein [Solirubrobacteraceae bacterium]
MNAVSWSLITPPFQVPDEPEHVAYVKQLAETGHLPSQFGSFSFEEAIVMEDVHLQTIAEQPQNQTISTPTQEHKLQRDLARGLRSPEKGSEYAGVAASEPPLYYALQSIPYTLGSGVTLLDRIELMRLLSAIMGGLTALFTFMFIRETLPGAAWAWTVGALCIALVPLLGFMSGAVNPDAMLYAVTAALFYCLAHAFRRGLTPAWALATGILIAVGFLTKLSFLGIAPGALVGLAVLSVRVRRSGGRSAYRSLAAAFAIALSPPIAYVIAHTASGAPALGIASKGLDHTGNSLWSQISYIWQLYLPRLPGMPADFAGVFTTRQIWFDWYVGLYGWLDTTFPGWVYDLALVPAGVIAVLCLRAVIARRGALRARGAELLVYGVMCVGLLVLIGMDSYRTFPRLDAEYGEVRYVLPMIPLLGAALALAARGAGRRWSHAVGAVMIALFLAHDVFSQLQVVARFYG